LWSNQHAENNGLNQIITLVINVFTVIVGFIAIVMMIYGGFKYITSGGDSGNVTAAKNTIMYALIGLVVVALAQLIVRFVLGKANNVTANVAMSLFRF
jgi:TRAP-type C4-dicarboxylate transport system permease small subunit